MGIISKEVCEVFIFRYSDISYLKENETILFYERICQYSGQVKIDDT